MNLSVLFIPQAPFQIWDAVHEETCEEASIAMIKAYYDGTEEMSAEEMDARLYAIIEYEKKTFGYFESTDAGQTASVLKDLYGLDARVVPIGSIDDIKREISAGRPVLLPASGRALMNPNFKNGGPEYHMVVVKGYTPTRIITNDPGTRRGADFAYDYDTLWKAVGDWTGSGTDTSIKSMIIVE